ncbi:MAG: DUF86 domain-containing protein [Methanobacteriota archaeon]
MDPERNVRYRDKIAHARHRLDVFLEWSPGAAGSLQVRLACYKAFQEAAEATLDVVSMMVKDSSRDSKDDYTNIAILQEAGIVSVEMAKSLNELNGLRNRLVHEYNGIRDELAIESGRRLVPRIASFFEEVGRWTSKRT